MNEPLYAFRICGIDYSTKAIDLVTINYDDHEYGLEHQWRHIDLGNRGKRRELEFTADLNVRSRLPGMVDWDEIRLVYIEKPPVGLNQDTLWKLSTIAGAIRASVPRWIVAEGSLLWSHPSTWRHTMGVDLSGRPKSEEIKRRVRRRAIQLGFDPPDAPLDAYEAFGIAWAGRRQNELDVTRARRLQRELAE